MRKNRILHFTIYKFVNIMDSLLDHKRTEKTLGKENLHEIILMQVLS